MCRRGRNLLVLLVATATAGASDVDGYRLALESRLMPPATRPTSPILPAEVSIDADDCNIVIAKRENRPLLVINSGGPQSTVRGVAFSPESDRLYTAGLDKTVQVWGFQVEARSVRRTAPNRAVLVQTIRWEIDRGPNGQIFSIAASPSQRHLAIAGFNARVTELNVGGDVIVYDTARNEVERVLHGHTAPVVNIAYSPSGKEIASASRYGQVILWREANQWQPEILQQPLGDIGVFVPIAFRGEDEVLFPKPGSNGKTWRLAIADARQAQNPPRVLEPDHANRMTAIAVDKVKGRIATADLTADGQGKVLVWSSDAVPTAKTLRSGRLALSMDFDPAGRLALSSALFPYADGTRQSAAELWDVDAGKMIDQVEVSSFEDAPACKVSPDGSRFVVYAADQAEMRVYLLKDRQGNLTDKPLSKGNPLRLKGHGRSLLKVAFDKAPGYRLGFGDKPPAIVKPNEFGVIDQGFDPSTLKPMSAADVSATTWRSPTEGAGQWNAVVGAGGSKVMIQNGKEKWAEIECRPRIEGLARCFAFLTAAGSDQPFAIVIGTGVQDRILVYAIKAKDEPCKLIRYFRDHSGSVSSLSVSSDGKYLASSSIDQTVKIWSLEGLRTLETRFGPAPGWGASFLFDDGKIIVGGVVEAGTAARKGIRDGDRVLDAVFTPAIMQMLGVDPSQPVKDPRAILRGLEESPLIELVLLTLERRGSRLNRQVLLMPAWSPVMTLYVDDRGEWATFTPQGYFASSVDGDELFGWQMNRGQSQKPDFFRADQFRRQLERPAALRQLLAAGSIQEALRLVDESPDERDPVLNAAAKTPRITIVSPTDAQVLADRKVPLVARVEYPSAELADQVASAAFVNGVPGRAVDQKLNHHERIYEWSAEVYDTYNRLRVVASDQEKEPMAFADVHFRLREQGETRKPKLHLFLMAAADYQNVEALAYPIKDAEAMMEILQKRSGDLYEMGSVKTLFDAQITRDKVQKTVDEWSQSLEGAKSDDLFVVFMAGHGLAVNGEYYFVPVQIDGPESVPTVGIPWSILRRLASIPCKKLVLLDTCHSGNVVPIRDAQVENWKSAIRPLKADDIMVVAATDSGQEALEIESLGHGVFTQALLDGFNGGADRQKDQEIDLQEIAEFVQAEVPRQTKDLQLQTPRSYPSELINVISVPMVSLR